MEQISLLIRIKAPTIAVYQQIATAQGIEKWFASAAITDAKNGQPPQLKLWGETDFEITELTPPNQITWYCTSENNPWFKSTISFSLREETNCTVVSFDHTGWPSISDLYRDCAMSWAYFLESLKSFIEDGAGTPEGVAPECESN